ncbi:hypothetical protein D9613_001220 [Agrocybe pediades]|uniref:Uncharacterized protein n=1 Tax=Agrocybe pediades TaxID=84607 RepID=A0A8H4R3C8_9AGAR|nr:hypothetical protein D9613_001220 [Agrocybe pediades]
METSGKDNLTILAKFFANYPEFTYDPSQPATSEFQRLCQCYDWPAKSPGKLSELDKDDQSEGKIERKKAEKGFKRALTRQFNSMYGTDEDRLEGWKDLCHKLGVKEVPDTLSECRKIVTGTHVNLIDLIDNGEASTFSTVAALSKYTKRTKKYFPRNNANAGNLLKYLLRHIANPSLDSCRGGTTNVASSQFKSRKEGRRSRVARSAKNILLDF